MKLKSSRGAVIRNWTVNNSSLKELSMILAIFGRFLLHGDVADVYIILSCVKNFTGINSLNRD